MFHSRCDPVPAPLGLGTRTRPAIAHRLVVCIVMAVLLLGPVLPGDAVARWVVHAERDALLAACDPARFTATAGSFQ